MNAREWTLRAVTLTVNNMKDNPNNHRHNDLIRVVEYSAYEDLTKERDHEKRRADNYSYEMDRQAEELDGFRLRLQDIEKLLKARGLQV